MREPEADLGPGRTPDFDKLVSLSAAAARVLDESSATPSEHVYALEQLTRAIVEDEGPAAAIAYTLERAIDEVPPSGPDDWSRTLAVLDAPTRARAFSALCDTLAVADPPPRVGAFLRAATRCRLDDPKVAATALAVAQTLVEMPVPSGYTPHVDRHDTRTQAMRWATAIALRHRPAETGAFACKALGHAVQPSIEDITFGPLAVAIARSGTHCDDVAPLLRRAPCGDAVEQGGRLCDAATLAGDTNEWASFDLRERPWEGQTRPILAMPAYDRAVLAALWAQGPLPPAITLPHARRKYALAPAPRGGAPLPTCSFDLPNGTPCSCREPLAGSWAICSVGPDQTRGHREACSFRLDDQKKRIDDVRSICREAGASCDDGSIGCCSGLSCLADADEHRSCRPSTR